MKKWFAALLVLFAASSHAAGDSSTNATVENVPATNEVGGFVVLRSADCKCRYYGALQQTARLPRGMVERIVALAQDGRVYDWMTVISYSACLQADGTYVKQRVSLDSPGGKRLRVGDSVELRSPV
ncbi:hypothetical protein M3I54_27895 [Paraburkholderia sp. CNPSo 3274]|uniref:hypothetical protein n=1 Tax=Paraburkholderia sp. CNPSo 3274 TaxID=2940932 RepID=UPI0020B82321|nr:hypothetical protein [Paraburkholderia sp. CNPSo 3274]MCP3710750.1 hypothetical protein [Paraburkholderia sp. CNPSo 3274]